MFFKLLEEYQNKLFVSAFEHEEKENISLYQIRNVDDPIFCIQFTTEKGSHADIWMKNLMILTGAMKKKNLDPFLPIAPDFEL